MSNTYFCSSYDDWRSCHLSKQNKFLALFLVDWEKPTSIPIVYSNRSNCQRNWRVDVEHDRKLDLGCLSSISQHEFSTILPNAICRRKWVCNNRNYVGEKCAANCWQHWMESIYFEFFSSTAHNNGSGSKFSALIFHIYPWFVTAKRTPPKSNENVVEISVNHVQKETHAVSKKKKSEKKCVTCRSKTQNISRWSHITVTKWIAMISWTQTAGCCETGGRRSL